MKQELSSLRTDLAHLSEAKSAAEARIERLHAQNREHDEIRAAKEQKLCEMQERVRDLVDELAQMETGRHKERQQFEATIQEIKVNLGLHQYQHIYIYGAGGSVAT